VNAAAPGLPPGAGLWHAQDDPLAGLDDDFAHARGLSVDRQLDDMGAARQREQCRRGANMATVNPDRRTREFGQYPHLACRRSARWLFGWRGADERRIRRGRLEPGRTIGVGLLPRVALGLTAAACQRQSGESAKDQHCHRPRGHATGVKVP